MTYCEHSRRIACWNQRLTYCCFQSTHIPAVSTAEEAVCIKHSLNELNDLNLKSFRIFTIKRLTVSDVFSERTRRVSRKLYSFYWPLPISPSALISKAKPHLGEPLSHRIKLIEKAAASKRQARRALALSSNLHSTLTPSTKDETALHHTGSYSPKPGPPEDQKRHQYSSSIRSVFQIHLSSYRWLWLT